MRLAVFTIVMLAAAIGVIATGVAQGAGIGTIILRAVIVLVVLQAAYFLWLLVVSRLSEKPETGTEPERKIEKPGLRAPKTSD